MDLKTSSIIESVSGYGEFEKLIERGRQMHNQAVFELFALLVSNTILFMKKSCGISIGKPGSGIYNRGQSINQTS